MNYSWRAHVIQEGTLLALDSDVGPWPKSTDTVHLSTDPQCLLFMGPKLSREELPLPRAAFQQTLVLFWGSNGAWEEREIFHHLSLAFPKAINLEHEGTSNPEGKVLLEAQCGEQEYLFELSRSQHQMCFLVTG